MSVPLLWGAYCPAYPMEGGGTNTDWFDWECSNPELVPTVDGADFVNRFESDVRLVSQAGLGALAIGVEWARIQPAARETSEVAIRHYRRVIESAMHAGLEVVVALNHRTLPRWVAALGGWSNPDTPKVFSEYADLVADRLGAGMYWTLVEPNTVAVSGYAEASGPPGKSSPEDFANAVANLGSAHRHAYEAIKMARPQSSVGLVLAASNWVAEPGYEKDLDRLRDVVEDRFWDFAREGDFVGVMAGGRVTVGAGPKPKTKSDKKPPGRIIGRVIDADAAAAVAKRANSMTSGMPVVVIDSVAGNDDSTRSRHIQTSVRGFTGLADEIQPAGWFYGPLLDAPMWGRDASSGLIEVDPRTLTRSARPSMDTLGDLIRENS